MTGDVIVGLDFGSSRIKAAAYDRTGELAAVAAVDTPLRQHADGDDFLVGGMLDAAAHAVGELACAPGSIKGIAMASMGETGAIVTPTGIADVDFPSWYDSRGADVVQRLERLWGAVPMRNATGRHLRTASTVAKLGHVRAVNGPLPTGTFVGICGAFAWQLTGALWQEAGLATTSGVFDIVKRDYLPWLWADAGLANVALAPVAPAGHGERATTPLARRLGLADDAVVVIAGHDHPVAAVGAGVRAGEVADSMGTGEAIIAVMGERGGDAAVLSQAMDADPYLAFEIWPADGSLLAVWERMRPGLAMRAFVDRSGIAREELDALAPAPAPAHAFGDSESLALEAGEDVALEYSPRMWGELVDFYVALANRGQRLLRETSLSDGATVLTGGGLRSPRWRAAKALLGDGPMAVSLVRETATRGCAAIVGTTLGWWPDPEGMPGALRRPIGPDAGADIEAAARLIGW